MGPAVNQFDEVASLCCADGRMVYLGVFPDGTYRIVREDQCICIWEPDDSTDAVRVFLALSRAHERRQVDRARDRERELWAGKFINN